MEHPTDKDKAGQREDKPKPQWKQVGPLTYTCSVCPPELKIRQELNPEKKPMKGQRLRRHLAALLEKHVRDLPLRY